MKATFARIGDIGETQRSFAMVINTILHCRSYEHWETSEDALHLVPKKGGDWDMIHEENDVIETSEELLSVKKKLNQDKYTCLVMKILHPRAYEIQEYGSNLTSEVPYVFHQRLLCACHSMH